MGSSAILNDGLQGATTASSREIHTELDSSADQPQRRDLPRTTALGSGVPLSSSPTAQTRRSGDGGSVQYAGHPQDFSRHRGQVRVRGRKVAAAASAVVLMMLVGVVGWERRWTGRYPEQRSRRTEFASSLSNARDGEADAALGIAASSSMWELPTSAMQLHEPPASRQRRRLLNGKGLPNLRGNGPLRQVPKNAGKRPGEPAMLTDFSKPSVENLNLDDVLEGHLWIPVSVEKFDSSTVDPLVKMCQVDYARYSAAPWLLPMGGLLSIASGCAEIHSSTVQILRMSALERVLRDSPVAPKQPAGFIFHETRCGSTLVANMLASVETNVMWSESTGPWKLMHTCNACPKNLIVPWLKIIMDAMTRSMHHNQFYFKFQSSEDIEPVTSAFPEVPWVFIFREPVEVMMSRLGAQRIGMEGMEKEVAAKVEKGMVPSKTPRAKKVNREAATAQILAGLCQKAIKAYENHPGRGMMVEYPHLPDGIVTTVLPEHFNVQVSPFERERMMNTTRMYSKVASFSKGSGDIKFTEDTDTKHDAASVAVTEAAQKFLYPDFYRLKGMQDWPED